MGNTAPGCNHDNHDNFATEGHCFVIFHFALHFAPRRGGIVICVPAKITTLAYQINLPMIKNLLKIGALLVIGLLGYNYFLGDETEKAQSREIVGKVGDLGKDAWNLLKSERQKLKEGKYDDALDKLDGLYQNLRGKAQDIQDSQLLEKIQELADRRTELENLLKDAGSEPSAAAKRQLDDLTAETEELMNEMEAKGKPSAPQ